MDTSQVIKAHEVAKKAHFGQIDRAGIDYIKHPETVASFVATDEEKAVAYLHDVIEDTSLTLLDLKKEGFSKNIIEAVDILTKKKGQDYQSYLNLVIAKYVSIETKYRITVSPIQRLRWHEREFLRCPIL